MSCRRYWLALAAVLIGSFAVLGGVGRKMISQAPPLPDVDTTDGQLLFTGSTITDDQGVWQSIGGQEIAQSGAMACTSLPTGLPTGCIVSRTNAYDLSMADLFLRSRGLLEHGGSRSLLLSRQSAHLTLLCAGPQPHAAAWLYRALWRLWNARPGLDTLLPARAQARRPWMQGA